MELKDKIKEIKKSRYSKVEQYLFDVFFNLKEVKIGIPINEKLFICKNITLRYYESNINSLPIMGINNKLWYTLKNNYELSQSEIINIIIKFSRELLNVNIIHVVKF